MKGWDLNWIAESILEQVLDVPDADRQQLTVAAPDFRMRKNMGNTNLNWCCPFFLVKNRHVAPRFLRTQSHEGSRKNKFTISKLLDY